MTHIANDLIEAYIGYKVDESFMNNEQIDPDGPKNEAIRLIQADTPKERLDVYLQWNGIIGWTNRIWEISQGEINA